MGHIKVSQGVKSLSVSFTPQFNNFPHAAASYQIKMANAVNATIRQGSDVFIYQINVAPQVPLFSSKLQYFGQEPTGGRNGRFRLDTWEYGKNLSGTYDLNLHYVYDSSNTHIRKLDFSYTLPALPQGDTILTCTATNLKIHLSAVDIDGVGAFTDDIDCGSASHTLILNVRKGVSPVYGDYYTFTGTVDVQSPKYTFTGNLDSDFLLFD